MQRFVIPLLTLALLPSSRADAADPKYVGVTADGTRLPGEFANWQDPGQQPTLGGRALFDAGNPYRWVLDTAAPPPSVPDSYVEFASGDRIPGIVVTARDGSQGRVERLPPHLVIKPELSFSPTDSPDDVVRVTSEWVQRVVWQKAVSDYRPGTLFLRDGRALTFRSLRWSETGVTLLINDAVQNLPFADLAEVHLPRRDPWDAWFEPLAVLCPDGAGRLIQVETVDGLRATTSTERFRPQVRGDRNKLEGWTQIVQPAWSLDPLWVKFRSIRSWRFHAPHQVPLDNLIPAAVKQESYFAASIRWQRDRSVQGQTLDVAATPFPGGFGVQARNELSFDLHPAVRTFRTRVGLDQAAGDGGCAQALIFLETDQRRPLFQSQTLVGSKTVVDSGSQSLALTPGKPAKLVLVADPMLQGRPAGTDPFDVRDFVDWLQPELELDPAAVKSELRQRSLARVAALAGWSMSPADLEHVKLVNHWDESNPRDPRFRVLVSADLPFVAASTRMRIGRSQRWLSVSATRPPTKTTPVRVQVRIEGQALGEFEVPANPSPAIPDPVLIPIETFQGKTVQVEMIQIPEKSDGAVDWRGVAAVERRPGLLRIFEDESGFAKQLNEGEGEATVETDKPYRGKASLKVTAPQRAGSRLSNLEAAIREFPDFGEYRFLRFAWRKDGGTQVALGLGHDGVFGGEPDARRGRGRPRTPGDRRGVVLDNRGLQVGYRYDAGKGPPLSGAAIRLGGPDPNWIEVTRDLYSDFGAFNLTGLQLGCPDGDAAWFDHIYLGRTVQDFEHIRDFLPPESKPATPAADPNIARTAGDRFELPHVLAPAASQFLAAGAPDPVLIQNVALLKTVRGKKNVVRTQGPDAKAPFVLQGAFELPAGKPAKLEIVAGHDDNAEWQLVVTANGQTVHDGVVGPATTKEGWLDLAIDLSRFAGQNILLKIEQRPLKDMRHPAYWSRAAVTGS